MSTSAQISAFIDVAVKDRMEAYVRETGVTRAHLVEQALLHHLQALEELPSDVVVPARMVLRQESAERVRDLVTRPPEPTEALRELFDDR